MLDRFSQSPVGIAIGVLVLAAAVVVVGVAIVYLLRIVQHLLAGLTGRMPDNLTAKPTDVGEENTPGSSTKCRADFEGWLPILGLVGLGGMIYLLAVYFVVPRYRRWDCETSFQHVLRKLDPTIDARIERCDFGAGDDGKDLCFVNFLNKSGTRQTIPREWSCANFTASFSGEEKVKILVDSLRGAGH